ncbi:PA0069 family radical SAM protein [Niveibacterium sp. SC-1]|uniref:PA0069 family radical SAM protein n=1 Tax=Niveibacterium sp. SC-1 TaxID=3135646 RepID=UPI00311E1C5E
MPPTVPKARPIAGPATPRDAFHGRGAAIRPDGRFDRWQREDFDDGWEPDPETETPPPPTELIVDTVKSVITFNQSPDIPFDRSINPYKGCEHGCSYCFARPTHSYLGLSPGIDFETKIAYKPDAPERLREELARPGYRPAPLALGINTDGWQPIERKLGLTRRLLEVLAEARHPISIVTKSALIERDLDLLADMAKDNLVQVFFSITTMDKALARAMEPRAATPERRLEALARTAEAGVPVGVLFAPLIPALNDQEMESVVEAAAARGASYAGSVILRLPYELAELFPAWLERHYPGRAAHVMSVLRQMRGGKDYQSEFGKRMRGEGVFADLYARRMKALTERLGLNKDRRALNCAAFRPPSQNPAQGELF